MSHPWHPAHRVSGKRRHCPQLSIAEGDGAMPTAGWGPLSPAGVATISSQCRAQSRSSTFAESSMSERWTNERFSQVISQCWVQGCERAVYSFMPPFTFHLNSTSVVLVHLLPRMLFLGYSVRVSLQVLLA